MTCCTGESALCTCSPIAFSRTRAMKSFTTLKWTSASSSARRPSRRPSSTSASVSTPLRDSFLKTALSFSVRLSNIGKEPREFPQSPEFLERELKERRELSRFPHTKKDPSTPEGRMRIVAECGGFVKKCHEVTKCARKTCQVAPPPRPRGRPTARTRFGEHCND